jgi:hypothetical protein
VLPPDFFGDLRRAFADSAHDLRIRPPPCGNRFDDRLSIGENVRRDVAAAGCIDAHVSILEPFPGLVKAYGDLELRLWSNCPPLGATESASAYRDVSRSAGSLGVRRNPHCRQARACSTELPALEACAGDLARAAELGDEAPPAMIAERSDDSEPAALKAASLAILRQPRRINGWRFPPGRGPGMDDRRYGARDDRAIAATRGPLESGPRCRGGACWVDYPGNS